MPTKPPPGRKGQIHRKHSPRFHDNPQAQFRPWQAIPRSMDILHYLDQRRFLLNRQVANRFLLRERLANQWAADPIMASGKAASSILKQLKDSRYLERLNVFYHASGGSMVRNQVNILTSSGAAALKQYMEATTGEVYEPRYKPSLKRFQDRTIDHELAVNDAIIAFEYACESWGITVAGVFDDAQLREEGTQFGTFTPDALLFLQSGGQTYPYLLEIDLGTESARGSAPNSWKSKMERYRDYFQANFAHGQVLDPTFQHTFHPHICTITTTQTRLDSIKTVTAEVGNRASYLFTTRAHTQPGGEDFFGPIWERPDYPGKHALFKTS